MSPATQRVLRSVEEPTTDHGAGCPDCTDGLGAATPVEHDSLRYRIRSKPGLAQV